MYMACRGCGCIWTREFAGGEGGGHRVVLGGMHVCIGSCAAATAHIYSTNNTHVLHQQVWLCFDKDMTIFDCPPNKTPEFLKCGKHVQLPSAKTGKHHHDKASE